MLIGLGVFDPWWSKNRGVPLTRLVALTTVLQYRADCDAYYIWERNSLGSQGHGSEVKVVQQRPWKSSELHRSGTAERIWTKFFHRIALRFIFCLVLYCFVVLCIIVCLAF